VVSLGPPTHKNGALTPTHGTRAFMGPLGMALTHFFIRTHRAVVSLRTSPSPTPKTCPLTPPTPTSPPTHTTHAHLTAPAHVRALHQARQGHAWAPWAWPRPIFFFARTARWCLCAPAKHHAEPPPKTCPLTPPTAHLTAPAHVPERPSSSSNRFIFDHCFCARIRHSALVVVAPLVAAVFQEYARTYVG
jgi:hypothetical protein